ncbi:MAG TPA: hypothetical protein PK347_11255 [Burkholderiaceae bacterium]|nr:hypothetical protein [Burkholderiaceae bacterium]
MSSLQSDLSAQPRPDVTSAASAAPGVALLTQHGKEDLIAPVFQRALGWRVERVDGFDTDLLGTFTRDRERPGSQIDAARIKARKGMELSGCRRGLASEGAFMEDPVGGFFPWNVELLVYIDDERGLEVIGMAQGAAANVHKWVNSWDELLQAANEARFPSHHLVLRPDDENHPHVIKGVSDEGGLRAAYEAALAQSTSGVVFVESDLRAFANPTRQGLIVAAAENLVAKLASLCPVCQCPGYAPVSPLRGLPCRQCGTPTRGLLGERWRCDGCGHEADVLQTRVRWADPAQCDRCNP